MAQKWTISHGAWSLNAALRTDLSTAERWRETQELARTGKYSEAAMSLVALSRDSDRSGDERAWYLSQAAVEFSKLRKDADVEDAYRAAVDLFQQKPGLRVLLLRSWGEYLARRNQPTEAQARFRQAIDESRRLEPNTVLEALSNYGLAASLSIQRRIVEQESFLRQAEIILQTRAAESIPMATIYNGLGIVTKNRGDLAAAESYLSRGIALRRKLQPDNAGTATLLTNMASVLMHRGDLLQAQEYGTESARIHEKFGPGSIDLCLSLVTLSTIVRYRGDYVQAEKYLNQGLALARKNEDQLQIAGVLLSLGNLARARGEHAYAQDYYKEALQIREKNHPSPEAISMILTGLGNAAQSLGRPSQAEQFHKRALDLRMQLVPAATLDIAVSLENLAAAALGQNDFSRAEELGSRALNLFREYAPDGVYVATTLHQLASIAMQRGNLQRAEGLFAQSLSIRERLIPGSPAHAESLQSLGAVAKLAGGQTKAREYFAAALDTLEKQVLRVGASEDSRLRYRAQYVNWYRDHTDSLIDLKLPDQAFDVLERGRGRSMLNLLAERDLVYGNEIPAALDQARRRNFTSFDQVQAEIAKLTSAHDAAKLNPLFDRMQNLQRERDELTRQIKAQSPRLAALQYPQPLTADKACQSLDLGTTLIGYSTHEKRVSVFVLSKSRPACVTVVPIPISKAQLKKEVDDFRQTILDKRDIKVPGRRLYDLLIKPIESQLASAERLVILPDGPLYSLPWAALLRRDGHYLIEWKPIHTSLSSTVYAELRRGRPNTTLPATIIAFGDPEYGPVPQQSNLPDRVAPSLLRRAVLWPLPYSRDEVQRITALFGEGGKFYVGAQATEMRAKSIRNEGRYLHFAVHGLIDEHQPLNSAIAFAQDSRVQGQAENGFLQAWEIIEQVRWDVDLVVLSACESARGVEFGGEGLIGLTRALHYAGARSVVASLWSVEDRRTSELMVSFYRHLKAGKPKDEALQSAQMEMIKSSSGSAPLHWASYVLNGDWK